MGTFDLTSGRKKEETETVKEYYEDGNLSREFQVNKKGEKNGFFKQYHNNGELQVEVSYTDGVQNGGTVVSFYSNGVKAREANLKKGSILDGPFKNYYESGSLKMEGAYKNDVLDGESKSYYENGNINEIAYSKYGLKKVRKKYYQNGELSKYFGWLDFCEQQLKKIYTFKDDEYSKVNMNKEKLFENLKLEFTNIKQFGVTFMAGGDAFQGFMNVEFDGESTTEENQNKFIKHIEGYIWGKIFNSSKYPIDVYFSGSGGNLQFYPEENKIQYQIFYYNNPDDSDDMDYEEECNQTF